MVKNKLDVSMSEVQGGLPTELGGTLVLRERKTASNAGLIDRYHQAVKFPLREFPTFVLSRVGLSDLKKYTDEEFINAYHLSRGIDQDPERLYPAEVHPQVWTQYEESTERMWDHLRACYLNQEHRAVIASGDRQQQLGIIKGIEDRTAEIPARTITLAIEDGAVVKAAPDPRGGARTWKCGFCGTGVTCAKTYCRQSRSRSLPLPL